MSLGYAERLSFREDVGAVGMTEMFDPPNVLRQKIEELTLMIQKSKHLVAFTGAGISTSCGIPDFRGPKGVWTLQREGKGVPEASLPFDRAMPSLTHMALVELEKMGILKFVISQNVDSLHLRSGIPRAKLAELHGNSFREMCPSCGAEYLRDFEVETIGMKETSRRCSDVKCGAKLTDTVLDWEQTPKDKKASLVIHGLVDKVVAGVMHWLNLRIPPYVRMDLVQISLTQHLKKKNKYVKWSLRIASVHGQRAPLPYLKSVEVSFPDRAYLKAATLHKQPFLLKRETLKTRPFKMVLDLNFGDGCGCASSRIELPVDFQASRSEFSHDKNLVFQKLRDMAIQDSSSGIYAGIERKNILEPKSEITSYAIVTNIVRYNCLLGLAAFEVIHRSLGPLGKFTKKRSESRNGNRGSPKRLKVS